MSTAIATIMLVLSALFSFALGAIVIYQNPYRNAHRAFTTLAVNLGLWALGVIMITHSHAEAPVLFWLRTTFVIAAFLPPSFYLFIGLFPGRRFDGPRWPLILLYAASVVVSVGAITPLYVKVEDIRFFPDAAPQVTRYGPMFYGYLGCVILTMLFCYPMLFRKLRTATGIERRQVEHEILGISLATTLAVVTNVLGPVFEVRSLEAYGPIFFLLMMGIFAYAMVRYHLLDVWVIVSRTTLYAVITAFVVAIFLGMVSLVHLTVSEGVRGSAVLPTLLAALVIALVLQPLKERAQLLLDRALVKRGYDAHRLMARVSQKAAQSVHLDQLLRVVADDLQATIGVAGIRVLLTDEGEPGTLVTEYSSVAEEVGRKNRDLQLLIDYMRRHPDPIILEELLHSRPGSEAIAIATDLAALDAYLCVPLRTIGGIVGILALGQKTSKDIYTVGDMVTFTALAGPLGTAIENARLYRRLAEVNFHLARVLSHMREGVVAVDARGKVSTVNQSAADMLGVSLGQGLSSLPPQIARVLTQTLQEKRPVNDFETQIVNTTGDRVPVVMSSTCLATPDQESRGAIAMIYDLSLVKRLEENVQRADRLSSIGTLAAGMAHEIKNPLVSIKTFAQLLPQRYADADFRTTFIEVVPHEVERIDSIVSRLLDFARPRPVHFAPQDLRAIIEGVLALVENETRKQNIRIVKELPDFSMEVHGDDQQLHQLFLNLVLNSVDALAQSSRRVLTVCACLDRMHIRRNGQTPVLEAECVKVLLSDTGCGIPEESLAHVFNPFFTTKVNGCGLGLAVVHSIVREHSGEIDVSSELGLGTRFTVSLPTARSMASLEQA